MDEMIPSEEKTKCLVSGCYESQKGGGVFQMYLM